MSRGRGDLAVLGSRGKGRVGDARGWMTDNEGVVEGGQGSQGVY